MLSRLSEDSEQRSETLLEEPCCRRSREPQLPRSRSKASCTSSPLFPEWSKTRPTSFSTSNAFRLSCTEQDQRPCGLKEEPRVKSYQARSRSIPKSRFSIPTFTSPRSLKAAHLPWRCD